MPQENEMTIDERLKYLRRMRPRYRAANRKERGALLDEMEKVTELHRKTLIRRMKGDLERRPRKRQRGRVYGARVDDALRVISETCDHITAERVTPNLVWLAQCLAGWGEIRVDAALLEQLGRISTSTVARILRRIGQDEPRLPRKGPREANRLRREVPMRRIPWDEAEPGHFEADLVHHCGSVLGGDYVHTVQLIDVTTGWSERVAVLGRSYLVMRDAFRRIVARLPFPILEIHPDNGSEFFNHHLHQFWGELIQGLVLSRSHPWQKNDNRFVEQKNDTLVRAYLGHERLDSAAQTRALNALYEDMWLYYNFFQPVMRLAAKTVIRDDQGNARIKRRYDQARTPFDRLCATNILPHTAQQEWARRRDQINPRQLRRSIYQQIDQLFRIPGATRDVSEDVYATLMTSIPA
jgi:hypothetical protein